MVFSNVTLESSNNTAKSSTSNVISYKLHLTNKGRHHTEDILNTVASHLSELIIYSDKQVSGGLVYTPKFKEDVCNILTQYPSLNTLGFGWSVIDFQKLTGQETINTATVQSLVLIECNIHDQTWLELFEYFPNLHYLKLINVKKVSRKKDSAEGKQATAVSFAYLPLKVTHHYLYQNIDSQSVDQKKTEKQLYRSKEGDDCLCIEISSFLHGEYRSMRDTLY